MFANEFPLYITRFVHAPNIRKLPYVIFFIRILSKSFGWCLRKETMADNDFFFSGYNNYDGRLLFCLAKIILAVVCHMGSSFGYSSIS